ncbi:MAG: acyltransferase [Hyphomicrobium sp.]|nr:acyltransferase [Hyphomicrobium sp.]
MLMTYSGVRITIGADCTVNPFTVLYGHGGLTIGNFVRIATHTVIVPANHIFADRDVPITKQGLSKLGVVIEDDVWIGAHVTILDGVTVGRGSVIAAGAVVNANVEPYSIVGGLPAKVIGQRS